MGDINSKNRIICGPVVFFLILALTISLISAQDEMPNAQEFERHYIDVSASVVTNLVNVSTDLNLSSIIPLQEYSSNIIIDWNIPNSAIVGIKSAGPIFVFIELSVINGSQYTYFSQENKKESNFETTLRCDITNNACGEGSVLRREIPFSIKIESPGINSLNDIILVKASLVPLPSFENMVNESKSINDTIAKMEEEINNLNVLDEEKENFTASLSDVKKKLNYFELEPAKEEILNLNKTLEDLKEKYSPQNEIINKFIKILPDNWFFLLGGSAIIVFVLILFFSNKNRKKRR